LLRNKSKPRLPLRADAVCLWKQLYEKSYVLYERGAEGFALIEGGIVGSFVADNRLGDDRRPVAAGPARSGSKKAPESGLSSIEALGASLAI